MSTLRYGRIRWSHEDFDPRVACRPNPIVTFNPIRVQGHLWHPRFSDKHALILLRKKGPKQIYFPMAYSSWRNSGAIEEKELGEGRAFLRWLQKYDLSIAWRMQDFKPHPYFCQEDSPKHDPQDEMAQGLSFAIRPVHVSGRHVKLYLQDESMLNLLSLPYGNEEDFLELVMKYVSQRFLWESWRAPAPQFIDWVVSQGKRPIFNQGQLGFNLG